MCLNCLRNHPNSPVEDPKTFALIRVGDKKPIDFIDQVYLHNLNGTKFKASRELVMEIRENALGIISTGVDCSFYVWAIQWPNEYQPKHFPVLQIND